MPHQEQGRGSTLESAPVWKAPWGGFQATSQHISLHTLGVRSNKQLSSTLPTCMQSSKIQNDSVLGGNAQLFCRGLLMLWFPFQKVGADGHEALSTAVLHLPHMYLLSSSCLILPANQHLLLHSEPLHVHLTTNTHHLSFPESFFYQDQQSGLTFLSYFQGGKDKWKEFHMPQRLLLKADRQL